MIIRKRQLLMACLLMAGSSLRAMEMPSEPLSAVEIERIEKGFGVIAQTEFKLFQEKCFKTNFTNPALLQVLDEECDAFASRLGEKFRTYLRSMLLEIMKKSELSKSIFSEDMIHILLNHQKHAVNWVHNFKGAISISQQCAAGVPLKDILVRISELKLLPNLLKEMIIDGKSLLGHAILWAPIDVVQQFLTWGFNPNGSFGEELAPFALLPHRTYTKESRQDKVKLINLLIQHGGDCLAVDVQTGHTIAYLLGACPNGERMIPFMRDVLANPRGTSSAEICRSGKIFYEFCRAYAISGNLKKLGQFSEILDGGVDPAAAVGILCGLAHVHGAAKFPELYNNMLEGLITELAFVVSKQSGMIIQGDEFSPRRFGPKLHTLWHYLVTFFIKADGDITPETLLYLINKECDLLNVESTDGIAPIDILLESANRDVSLLLLAQKLFEMNPKVAFSKGKDPARFWNKVIEIVEKHLLTKEIEEACANFLIDLIQNVACDQFDKTQSTFEGLRRDTERLLQKCPNFWITLLNRISQVNVLAAKSIFTIFPDKNADEVMPQIVADPEALVAFLPFCSPKVLATLNPCYALGKQVIEIMRSKPGTLNKADALLDLAITTKNKNLFLLVLSTFDSFTKSKAAQPQQNGAKKGRAMKKGASAKPETALDRGLGFLDLITDRDLQGRCYVLLKYRGANLALESSIGLSFQEREVDFVEDPDQENFFIKILIVRENLRADLIKNNANDAITAAPVPQNKPAAQPMSKNQKRKLTAAQKKAEEDLKRAEDERKQKERIAAERLKAERELEKKRQAEEIVRKAEEDRIAKEQAEIKRVEEEKRAQEQRIIQEQLDQQAEAKQRAVQLQNSLDQYHKLQEQIALLRAYKDALPEEYKKLFEQEQIAWKQVGKMASHEHASATLLHGSHLGLPCNIMAFELQDQFVDDADRDPELEKIRLLIKNGTITYSPTIIYRHMLTRSSCLGYFDVNMQETAIDKIFVVNDKGINASLIINKVYDLKIPAGDLQETVLQKLDPLHTLTTQSYCANKGQIIGDLLDERAVRDGLVSSFVTEKGVQFVTFRLPCFVSISCVKNRPEQARSVLGFYEISFSRSNIASGVIVHKFIRPWNKLRLNDPIDKLHLKNLECYIRANFKAILAAALDADRPALEAALREFLGWGKKNL